jgi:hypothetical protein
VAQRQAAGPHPRPGGPAVNDGVIDRLQSGEAVAGLGHVRPGHGGVVIHAGRHDPAGVACHLPALLPQPKGLPGAVWVRRRRPNAQRLAHPPPWCSRMVRWELRSRIGQRGRPNGSSMVRLGRSRCGWNSNGRCAGWSNTSMTRNGNQVSVLDPVHAHPADSGALTGVSAGQDQCGPARILNLGPHPYQLSAGNRCADRHSPRLRATVGAEGMRSIRPMVCVHLSRR